MSPTPHQYTVTPWRHPSELRAIRTALYNPTTPTDRTQALTLITAWKARSNLPHAIESTALLFSALQFHESLLSPQNSSTLTPAVASELDAASTFAIRATYTTSLSRFVTGFADLGRHRAGPGQTMQEVARSINLPARFVELRHEATHEELPGLGRLVRMSQEAVEWLWDVYWRDLEDRIGGEGEGKKASRQTEEEMGMEDERDGVAVREQAVEVLKGFRSRNLANLKGTNKVDATRAEVKGTCQLCLEICGGSTRKWSGFVAVLMQLIIPSRGDEETISKHMEGAKLLWEDLLRKLATSSSTFVTTLIEAVVTELAGKPGRTSSSRVDAGLRFWLERILTSTLWRKTLQNQPQVDVYDLAVETCCLHPASSSKDVAGMVLQAKKSDSSFSQKWEPAYQAAFGAADEDDEMDEDEMEPANTDLQFESTQPELEDGEQMPAGWRIDRGPWSSVPIGAVRAS